MSFVKNNSKNIWNSQMLALSLFKQLPKTGFHSSHSSFFVNLKHIIMKSVFNFSFSGGGAE